MSVSPPPPTNQHRLLYQLGDACWQIRDLAVQLELSHAQVSQAAALLIGRALVERVEAGCFRLTAEGKTAVANGMTISTGVTGPVRKARPPKRVSIRQRAWNAMKIAKTFTVRDIVTSVARADDGNVEENIRRYCSALSKAGYLRRQMRRRQGSAPSSNGFAVYELVKDTGRFAPVISSKAGSIHDFNGGAA